MTFDDYWSTLISAGWFEARSDARVTKVRERLEAVWSASPADTVYELGFGVAYYEDFYERDFLGSILRAYADAAEGLFTPTDVLTEFPGRERVLLAFTHQGRRFSREAPYLGGEIEPAMDSLCNEALAATEAPYRFFPVPHVDLYAVALVRPSAHETIKRRGWLTVSPLPGGRWGAIVEGLHDPVARIMAHVRAEGATPDVLATVTSLAGSNDSVLREWVAQALGELSGDSADEALLPLLCDRDRHVQAHARRSLQQRVSEDARVRTWWTSRLTAMVQDEGRGPGAVAALGELATGEALQRTAEALVDPSQPVRDAARAAMMAASGPGWASSAAVRSAVPLVLDRVKTAGDRAVRLAALEVLRLSRDPRAVPVLLGVALDGDLDGFPASTLDEIDREWPKHGAASAQLPYLKEQALCHPVEEMRRVADNLVRRIEGRLEHHPERLAALVKLLQIPAMRMFALQALLVTGDPGAIPAIEPLRDDPDPEVRRMALQVLATLSGSEGH
jgi:HEAT repeat protein